MKRRPDGGGLGSGRQSFHGVVIGTVTSPLVNEGDALIHLARPGRPEDATARIQDLVPDVGDTTDPGAISRDAWPREPFPAGD